MIPQLSIVAPATGGLPVAYGVCEALRAKQVYWAERENETQPLRFRQFMEPEAGEQVMLVDDILRSGNNLTEMRALLEATAPKVVGLAVIDLSADAADARISAICRSITWRNSKQATTPTQRRCELVPREECPLSNRFGFKLDIC